MKEDVLFRKTPFGGFKREEVIDYIQKLKQTQMNYKKMLDEKDVLNSNLADENEKLKNSDGKYLNIRNEYDEKIALLEEEIADLKIKNDFLSNNAKNYETGEKDIATQVINKCDELVETANHTAKELENKAKCKIKQAADMIESNKDMSSDEITDMLNQLVRELDND